ncbi:MAG TPA: type II toxin-antitoxin system RatA family toxin [Burkholderiaceae bacterium]|jgi:ribosome-associated toxin RatA of RatAB toxin-antitoxin module|nr:type II toxin-antitoxin system RatA family toxin [Burkholderiaceae bacterium]
MKHVKKSVLLWYSPREMYDLVVAVPDYPKFLPWCSKAEVLEGGEASLTARLHLNYHGVRHAFTTRNVNVPGESMVMTLVDGPFSVLDGTWRFLPLNAAPEGNAQACKVEFDLKYAFNSIALETVVSPVFDRIANSFVDAFVKRAEQVYGAR